MEAAGIEPASRDMAAQASTCVADALYFTPPGVRRQTTGRAIGELVLTADVPHVLGGGPELATNFWVSPAKARSRWLH